MIVIKHDPYDLAEQQARAQQEAARMAAHREFLAAEAERARREARR